jgi:hypothetical protein
LTCFLFSQQDSTSTISPQFIAAQKTLKVAKSRIRDLKRRKLATEDPAAWALYPPPSAGPRDPRDPRFTRSFDVTTLLPPALCLSEADRLETEAEIASQLEEVQNFFELYGFVVFSNVLTTEECTATEAEIWVRK